MEQCFIVGNVYDKTGQSHGRSNGAGKSSLMQAVLWCLSGKTVYNQNPGDKVLNWFTSTNARVALKFKNGDELVRIRTRQGDTELLFRRGTQEIINCTLSTTSNQQRLLDKELKFDYGLFCGSVFFSQYRQPWLAMQDQARRQAFERIMGIDRLSIYAEVAKSKYDRVVQEQEKRQIKIDSLSTNIANAIQQLDLAQKSSSSFESTRSERYKTKLQRVAEYEEQARQFTLIDTVALAKKWAIVAKIEAKIKELESQINELESQINAAKSGISAAENTKLQAVIRLKEEAQKSKNQIIKLIQVKKNTAQNASEKVKATQEKGKKVYNQKILDLRGQIADQNGIVNTQNAIIKKWRDKAGKICIECEQELPADYANSKIDGPQAVKLVAIDEIKKLTAEIESVNNKIAEIQVQINDTTIDATNALKAIDNESDTLISAISTQLEESVAIAEAQEASIKTELNTKKAELQTKKIKIEQLIVATRAKLTSTKPEMTVNEANATNAQRDTILDSARQASEDAANIAAEKNTHAESIINLGRNIKLQEDQVKVEQKDLATYDIILVHLQYIQKAYSDRRKIKSYLIGRHQPYFNSRLHHYLDLFGLDIKVSLTDSLGIDSNLWGYDFQSGGERGRTDLAFMFAVFDLHQGIHGPQSNILVLDEPEKALDESGRQMLISVIKDDLATRFESIFIISHSDCFHDVFPHQITVERTDRFSHITDIR
jgi:DNA repair exonuclease SbcCD ATPase subunit